MTDQNLGNTSYSDGDVRLADGPGALTYEPEPMAMSDDSYVVTGSPSNAVGFRRFTKRLGAVLGVVFLLSTGTLITISVNKSEEQTPSGVQFLSPIEIPLSDLPSEGKIDLGGRILSINGPLKINDTFVLTPQSQPTQAIAGQLYYDETSNTLSYYNGSDFVALGGDMQSLGGLTGQVALGTGLSSGGGQISNSGVLSVQGQTGNITLNAGNGISIDGTTITNSGVIGVTSSSPNLTVSSDGAGNISLGLGGAGTGTVTSAGGTSGRLPLFTGSQNVEDSALSQSGTVVTVNGDLTVTGALTLSNALTVSNGGTGATTLSANGVLIGNGSGAISSIVAGSPGQCLTSTAGAPAWASCGGGSGTVTSLNGLTGALTIANATGLVNTITIDDASTSNKGIAQFNNTNFNVVNGNVNTAQNISTGSSPTFNGLTLSGNLTVQGGTSTLGTLTQAGSIAISDGSSHTVTIVASNLSADRIYSLPDAGGDATLCVTAGNCIGGSGSAPNSADYLVANLNGTLTNERALGGGSNIALTDGGANASLTVATVQNPTFTTSVTTPALQSSGALVITSAAGNTVAIDAATTIELQDSTNVTGNLDVSLGLNVGAANAFVVNSSGVVTAAAGITSSGTITFSGLNCTGNANGGALTTNGSGQLVCSDDDGGAGGGISGSGASGTIPVFNGGSSITNSIITQSGSSISIAGDLTLTTDLTVSNGGTGASSFTSNGILYGNNTGAIQVTTAGTGGQVLVANGSGVPTFVSFSGDVAVSNTGVTSIQPNSVALGTDTAGDYVTNLGALTGLSTSGNSGEGSTPTLSVNYGSIANTAVQGNVTLTCPSGAGNLTGGGTSITLGTGGSCANLNTVNNPTFTISVTTPNLILTGAGSNGSIVVGNLGQGTIYTLPDPNQAAADICISTGNCATAGAAGGDLTGSYPNPTIARFQGTDVDISSPLAGHILVWNDTNSAWENHSVSSDITLSETGVATIQSNAVALGGDTTGNYVIGLTAGNGISVSGSAGEGWSPSVAVLYGSSANTAVQGNTSISVTAGTNLTGGGSITLGAGGTVTLNIASSPIFSGTLTVQGATATVGTTSVQGGVVIHDGAGETGTIQTGAGLSQSVTYTLPDPGQATADICISTGNCAGAGGGVTGSGTDDRLAKFTSTGSVIGDSLVSDDGSTVIITGTGNFVVQGGTATLGTLTQAGTLSVSDGSNHTVSIVAAGVAANRTFTLPETGGAATFCMSTGNCIGGGGGGAPNDATYLLTSLNGTLTNDRALASGNNIAFTDGGANGSFTVATVQNPTFTTSVTTPQLQSSGALAITSGSGTVAIDATTTIELQDNTNVTGVLDVSASLNVGTGNAFAVNSSGAVTAATGLTSSGTITFSGLDCTTFANGGSVTTNASGVLSCSDDDGAAAGTITGSGTNGTIALFSGTNSVGDSVITQSGSVVTISGSLTLTTDLTVSNGGTGASSFTSNGVLYGNNTGAIQVTAAGTGGQVLVANGSGVPTFVSFSGDVNVSSTGVASIQANSVALGTDTAGDYVANLGALTGLSTSGNSGEGSTPTLSVTYGSGANTAVQGNTTLTCPSGAGNLSGGGTSITLGTGGSCANLNTVNNPTFSTSVTTPNLIFTGVGSNGNIVIDNLGQSTTFTLPNPNQATADICLSTGNCTAVGTAGGDLTGSYPNPTVAKLQGTTLTINTVASGNILQYNGSAWVNQSISGDIALNSSGVATIQANSVALGTDTAGDYVANLGALTGLNTTGNSGEGSTPTLSVAYGSSANTAVQGNVTLTCPSGTGNLSGGGTSITLGTGGACGNITITNSPTFTGTLTVNTIDASSAMTIGDTGQNLTLQGNATTELTATDSGNTTTVGFATPVADINILFPALASGGPYTVCTSSGNCGGVGATLQTAYTNSTGGSTPEILLDATRAAVTLRDNSTPIVGNLLEIQNNNGSTTYFAVTAAGIQTTGTMISSGNINTTGGGINTGAGAGTQRIDNTGNLVNIGNITGAAGITIATTGANALNLTGGANSTWTVGSGNTLGITSSNFNVSTGGVLNMVGGAAGFQIGGSAATGNYLRGNGTSFVSSAIQSSDIPICSGACNYIANQNSGQQSSSNFWISGTGRADNVLQAPLFDTASAGTLAIGTTNATGINLNQSSTVAATKNFTVTSGLTSLTGNTTGDALNVSNSTSTGNIALFKDNNINVFTLADGGAATFRNSTDSAAAFQIQNATSQSLLNVDAINRGVTVSSVAASSLFGTKVDYATAASPLGAATADFDKDGDMDMVVANSGPNTVSVFMNNGSGTFAAKVDYAVGTSPSYIATADFDKDGDIDLAVTNGGAATVSILMNNGSGSNFTLSSTLTAGTNPRNIIATDFDKDGDIDLAVTNYTVPSFSVFLNTGTGTFAAKADYTTDFTPFGITAADFDKDGDMDVAVANNDSDEVSIFTNDGTTDFDNIARADYDIFPVGGEGQDPNGLVSGDIDKDGDIDLVTANDTSNTLSVMFNSGGAFNDVVEYSTGTTPTNLAIVDIDKDGDLDLLSTNRGSDTVSVFRNNGSGTFAPKMDFMTASNPYSVVATDFDKDGDIDIAATNNGPGTVSVFINTTLAVSPTATPTLTLYSGGVNEVLQVRSTDDRRLLSVDARGGTTIGDVSNSDGALFARKRDTASGGIDHPYGITAGDIDKDGDNDLAVVALGSGTLDIYINNGNGNFGLSATYTVGSTPIDVASGDFNKDGHVDFAVTNEADDTVSIVLNDGDNTFTVQGTTPATADQPEGIVAGDIDKDGDIDIITANAGASDNVSVLKNNGSGTFAAKVDYAVGTNPYHIATADFDKDGDLDVVTANQSTSNASVLIFNSGTGLFAAAVNYPTGTTATAVKTADFDKDGDIDFATGNSVTISVFMNNGSGLFAAAVNYPSTWVQDMAVGDFDRDGDVDIAAADDNFPGHAKVFLNNGSGIFATPTLDHTTGEYPIAIVASDFDKDGDIDLATANEVTDNVSVLLNSTVSGDRFKVLSGDSMPLFTVSNSGLQIGDGITGVNTYAYGEATFLAPTDSVQAFRVLNASGGAALVMDTLNTRLGIGTTSPRAPLDIKGEKIFNVGVDQGNDTVDRYYRLATIGTNNGEVEVEGILAGHAQTQGKGNIDLKISGRDGFLVTGSELGTIGTSSDIVVYYDGVSTYTVWLKTDQWALVNLDVSHSGATISYDGTYQTTTPSGTLTFTLSTDTSPTILHMNNSGVFNTYGGGFNLNKNDSTAGLFVLDTKNTTGDPATGLTNGAMYYNSYTNRFRCYEDTRWTNCTSSANEYDILDQVDEFMTGGVTAGTGGSMSWGMFNSASGGTLAPITAEQNHPGITRLGTGATSGNVTSMVMDGSNGIASVVAGDVNYFGAIVRPDTGSSSMSTRIGILNTSLTSGEASQGIYFSFLPGTSANWRTITKSGTGTTANTTSVAYTPGTWYRLEMRKNNSGNWEFYINGTLVFTHSTSANFPTSTLQMVPGFAIETNSAATKTIDIDWARLRSTVLSR